MTNHPIDAPSFYMTTPAACPYLPGKQERKVFTHLVGSNANVVNSILSEGGFRRSQSIAYRPACENCKACVSVRVVVDEFKPSRNQRRILARNRDLVSVIGPAASTPEQHRLFRSYLDARHADGGMADMSVFDYMMMIEDTHVETRIIELRERTADTGISGKTGRLVGVALTDILKDGLSMVYAFFDPEQEERSLGTQLILDHIERARAMGLPYLYLGYWIEGSRKMSYKIRFQPQEALTTTGWKRMAPE